MKTAAAAADYLSPFASSFAQHQASPPRTPISPPEPSRSNSPLRVVGFDSSPTSVVALRRWQSAAAPGTAAAMEAAAAMDAALAATSCKAAAAAAAGSPGFPHPAQAPQRSASLERKVCCLRPTSVLCPMLVCACLPRGCPDGSAPSALSRS